MPIRPLLLFALIMGLLTGQMARAAEAELYEVEVWIFSHQNRSALTSEYWNPALQPELSERAGRLQTQDPRAPFFRLGEPRALDYGSILTANRGYQPLFRARWIQPIAEGRATPLHIEGGQLLNDGQRELFGDLSLDRGRYLHLRTNLYYRTPLAAGAPVSLRPTAAASAAPELTPSEDQPLLQVSLPEPARPDLLTVKMDQGRRMRSNEVHYLDHPLFGLLVQVTPYEAER